MSAEQEVKDTIHKNWLDQKVADWVIKNLPLLEYGHTHPQCPIFELNFDKGLVQTNLEVAKVENFKGSDKIVISGGMEGTAGNLYAVNQVQHARALTSIDSLTVIMLEPNSYINNLKKRTPIVNLIQRIDLWSTSGLVDAVIALPERDLGVDVSSHYLRIHDLISPAVWCASIENPKWYEIITRHDREPFNVTRLLDHKPDIHTSFLNSTMQSNVSEVRKRLFEYASCMAKDIKIFNPKQIATQEEIVESLLLRMTEGL